MRELIENYLEVEPRARERRFHKRAIVNVLLQNKYPKLKDIDKDLLIDFCADFENGTRLWRDILQFREDLRGLDYVDKKVYTQNKLIQLDSARLQAIKNI